jgi:feruloyl esterase
MPVPGQSPALTLRGLPEFCRIQGVIEPAADSHIGFEVWLPAKDWNGKLEGFGNAGFGGEMSYTQMAFALLSRYASTSTDTGHKGGATDARWALNQPQKILDYGYRAVHETAEISKAIVRAFYGEPARHSYFNGCSTGGRQALMEAQRYPADYDGIIAGAPAANFTGLVGSFAWNVLATAADSASYIPATKFSAIETAVLAQCDAGDGVVDGILGEPDKCTFDPRVLSCADVETNSCLTPAQMTALNKIYRGPHTARGKQLYPGLMPGGESGAGGWGLWIAGLSARNSLDYLFSTQGNAYLVFQNPNYDYHAFNADRDVPTAERLLGRTLNAVDPNLRAFWKRGGKLIMYHGWSDPALAPTATIDYYRSVVSKMGKRQADNFVRLYMMPGMQHCLGGPGADDFGVAPTVRRATDVPGPGMSDALERWVEHGVMPVALVATKSSTGGTVEHNTRPTRLLCPYPQIARYLGSGDAWDAANFVCADAARPRDQSAQSTK